MRPPLQVRRGLIVGAALALILAASIAGRSADPIPTFASVFGVSIVGVLLAVAFMAWINRRS